MKYYKRGFLNEHEGFAAFESKVEYEGKHKHDSIYTDFSISDCNRKVCLEFSVYDEADYQKSMYKVNSLIGELNKFKRKLMSAQGEYEKAAVKFEAENEIY